MILMPLKRRLILNLGSSGSLNFRFLFFETAMWGLFPTLAVWNSWFLSHLYRVQKAYALQCMGRIKEATELYNQVAKQKWVTSPFSSIVTFEIRLRDIPSLIWRPDDIALNAVLSNNIVTLNKDQNVFDSKKKIKAATIQRLQQKLTSLQRRAIAMNQCLLYMYMNQVSNFTSCPGHFCRSILKFWFSSFISEWSMQKDSSVSPEGPPWTGCTNSHWSCPILSG